MSPTMPPSTEASTIAKLEARVRELESVLTLKVLEVEQYKARESAQLRAFRDYIGQSKIDLRELYDWMGKKLGVK